MQKQHVLITGGSGLIGRPLTTALLADEHAVTILTRSPERFRHRPGESVSLCAALSDAGANRPVDAVVNLAGARIVGARWTARRKQVLRASRIGLTEGLVDWMLRQEPPPGVLVSGSATGYYGDCGSRPVDETHAPGDDFGAHLCRDWERAAQRAVDAGIRVACVRTGLVLSAGGGMLPPMRLSFGLGLGARIGDGTQWMSWIHIDDHVAAIRHLLSRTESAGPYNLTAPGPVTNSEFSDTLAKTLRRPRLFVAPAPVLRAALGESAQLLLGGQKVLPERLTDEGFTFRFPDLPLALEDLLGKR